MSQPFHCTLDTRWRDLDALNHVNNSNYLTYLEEARLRWLQTLESPWATDDHTPVLAGVELGFRKPITWPCRIDVMLEVTRVGRTSLTIGHRITDVEDSACLYLDGHCTLVWIDRHTGQPIPLPDELREAYS